MAIFGGFDVDWNDAVFCRFKCAKAGVCGEGGGGGGEWRGGTRIRTREW